MTSNVLGGIGAGLMQGVQFMNARRQADSQDAYRKQVLDNQATQLQMQRDLHNAKMGEIDLAKTERERAETLGKLRLGIEENYAALPDYERETMFIDNGLKTGLIKPEELSAAKKSYDGMIKVAGIEAFDQAVKFGNIAPLQGVFKSKGLGEITLDGDGFVINAGGKAARLDRNGLLQMSVMAGAHEREIARQKAAADAQKAAAELAKTNSERRKNDRMYGMVTNPDGTQSYIGRGAGTPGAAGGNGSVAPTYAKLGFKDQGDMQDFVLKGIGDEGLSFSNGAGETSTIPKEEAALGIQQNFDLLADANPNLPPIMLRNIAQSVVLAEKGANLDGAQYVPTPALNMQTGKWESVIRSADKVVAKLPRAVIEPTPEQKLEQEGVFATRLVDSGVATKLTNMLKDKPEYVSKIARALNGDQQEAAAIEAASPGFLRQFQVLYTHTGLGGLVVPDQRLMDERSAVQAERAKLLQGGSDRSGKANQPAPTFSQDEIARAQEAGGRDTPAVGVGEIIGEGVSAVGEGIGLIGDAATGAVNERAFSIGLDAARKSGFRIKNVVDGLANMLEKNPRLAANMPESELWALSIAANRRLSDAVFQNAKKSQ